VFDADIEVRRLALGAQLIGDPLVVEGSRARSARAIKAVSRSARKPFGGGSSGVNRPAGLIALYEPRFGTAKKLNARSTS